MRVVLESTTQVVTLNGIEARVWVGKTDSGIPVQAFVTRIAVERTEDQGPFEAELKEQRTPIEAWPFRMIL